MMERFTCSRGLGLAPASGKDIYFSIACCDHLDSVYRTCIEQVFCVTMQVKMKMQINQNEIRSEQHGV